MKSRVNTSFVASVILSVALTASETAFALDTVYDQDPVNGHTGFLSAWRVTGELDKPVILVKGYDTVNDGQSYRLSFIIDGDTCSGDLGTTCGSNPRLQDPGSGRWDLPPEQNLARG